MLSNNHTSDQLYEVKQKFSCWIFEFLLRISSTTNKGFLYLILTMMWQMFELVCVSFHNQLWTFRLWKF